MTIKKIICMILMGLIIAVCLAACSEPQNHLPDNPLSENSLPDILPEPISFYYTSIEGFYQGLKEMSQTDLEYVQYRETQVMQSARETTRVSEDEERDGIFGHVRNKLLEKKTLLLPFYQGKQIPLDVSFYGDYEIPSIIFEVSGVFGKPQITYCGNIDGLFVGFRIGFYDEALIDEANKNGASWLMSQMEPDGLNVYNYESKRDSATFVDGTKSKMTVYEKEYRLGDRDVMAMVIDNSFLSTNPVVTIYFVYDDMLISVNFNPEKVEVEKILAEITFHKVYLPTNTPMEGE